MAGRGALGAFLSTAGGAAVTAGKLGYEEQAKQHAEEAQALREQKLAEMRQQYQKEAFGWQTQAAKEAEQRRFAHEKSLTGMRGAEQRKTEAARTNQPKPKDIEKERTAAIEAIQMQPEWADLPPAKQRAALAEIEKATSSGKSSAFRAVQDIGSKYFNIATPVEEKGWISRLWDSMFGGEGSAPTPEQPAAPAQPMPKAMSEAQYREMYKQKKPDATPEQIDAGVSAMKAAGRVY